MLFQILLKRAKFNKNINETRLDEIFNMYNQLPEKNLNSLQITTICKK